MFLVQRWCCTTLKNVGARGLHSILVQVVPIYYCAHKERVPELVSFALRNLETLRVVARVGIHNVRGFIAHKVPGTDLTTGSLLSQVGSWLDRRHQPLNHLEQEI